MTADPTQNHEHDATNQGVSTPDPAEGADDAPAGGSDSPESIIVGETADEL
jgi:hypothetical protein